jgi:hypothetical protein
MPESGANRISGKDELIRQCGNATGIFENLKMKIPN